MASLVEVRKMRAAVGDEVLVKGRRVGDEGREGVPGGVQGGDGDPHPGAHARASWKIAIARPDRVGARMSGRSR